ncbi:MAG: site-specific integrase, partial [Thaumarchaeota archaeon]|nr:site-specific integrase [Nitrososphaerota archaeon]
MDKSLVVFEKYVKAQRTKENYQYFFSKFMEWCKANVDKLITADGLLILKETGLQTIVEDYVMYLRKKVSPNSLTPILASIELYFAMNDKVLNWKRIKKMIPEKVKKSGKSAYQTEDIKKLLDGCRSKRNRCIVLMMTSTGCRVGALENLKLKHIANMPDGTKSVLFYENSTEEYYGFLTQEASKALDEMLVERQRDGERLDGESCVFRETYQVGIQKSKPMSLRAIKLVLLRAVRNVERRKNGNRFEIMTSHGIRKRFATIIKMNKNIPYSVGERLLAHQIDLDPSYFSPTKD